MSMIKYHVPVNRVVQIAILIVSAVLLASTPASATSPTISEFTGTYKSLNVWSWSADKCVGSSYDGMYGNEPTQAGKYPVYVFLHGTYAAYNGPEAAVFTSHMANRGFVAASVHYDDFAAFTNNGLNKNSACIFRESNPSSAIAKLCSRPKADCSKGIVVSGFSQGAAIALRARNQDARVRGAYLLGMNEESSVENGARLQSATAMPAGSRQLPNERIRIIDGASDAPVDRRDELNLQTGAACAVMSSDCLNPNTGAGWYVVQDSQVADGVADHCYFHGGGGGAWGCKVNPPFDPTWLTSSTQPWALEPSLNWLARQVN